jgi:ribosome-binding protein aMBF1 (putative translation factor)
MRSLQKETENPPSSAQLGSEVELGSGNQERASMPAEKLSSEAMRRIGRAFRQARLKQNLSLEGAAYVLGLRPNFLSRVETGVSSPSLPKLIRAMEVIGLDPNDLRGPQDGK